MRNPKLLYAITIICAFCSMTYELILAQALSAFLENTVMRYSITIGLYMFSMGIGSLFTEGKLTDKPIATLMRVEILLTALGGFSLIYLFGMDALNAPAWAFSTFAYLLIITIGIMTGMEIPLLIELTKPRSANTIIGLDYVGAFCGTLAFAFVFYPLLGLTASAFLIGLLNILICLTLCCTPNQSQNKWIFVVSIAFAFILIIGLVSHQTINQLLIESYLN